MNSKVILLACCSMALVLAGCGKKAEPVVAGADPGAGVSSGEATPAATPAASSVTINTGAPVDGDVTLTAPPRAVAGSRVDFTFAGPANARDYIDIVPRGNTQTSGEISYVYVDAAAKNGVRAPAAAGEYDLRYILELGGERKIKVVSALTVDAGKAELTAPAEAGSAEVVSVAWTGPNGQGDYIDIVPKGFTGTSGEISYAYTSAGTPAKVVAPGPAGEYQLRYLLEGPGGRKVIASYPLLVKAATATLKAPDTAAKGAKLSVDWTGPKRNGDYVDLVPKGYDRTSGELSYFYTTVGATGQLTAPGEAGEYEIRYVQEAPKERMVLARKALTVR